MNKILMKLLLLFIVISGLTACSLFSPVNTNPPNTYLLNKLPDRFPHYTYHAKTILVGIPDTNPVFNTSQMAYTTSLYRVAYYSKNQWAETPSQMLLPLLVQTLQNTHAYRAVLAMPAAGYYDYVLNTQIVQLQQNFLHHPAMLQLSVRAQIVNAASNRVIASKQFTAWLPLKKNAPYYGVLAANQAVASVLRQIAVFCRKNT